jgi:tetratricopeptide (TPR) repeat protein
MTPPQNTPKETAENSDPHSEKSDAEDVNRSDIEPPAHTSAVENQGQSNQSPELTDLARLHLDRGLEYANNKDFDHAIQEYDKSIQLNPHNAITYKNRGNAYFDKGDLGRALNDYTRAQETDPNYADAYFNRGLVYAEKGDYDHAIGEYNRVIQLNPNDSTALNERGWAHFLNNDPDRAFSDFSLAIRNDRNNANAYFGRAMVCLNAGDNNRAIRDFNQAIKLTPDDATSHYYRGVAYYRLSDLEYAISDFDTAIKIDPNYSVAYHDRGLANYKKGVLVQASIDYLHAILLKPKSVRVYQDRRLIHNQKADLYWALRESNQTIQTIPGNKAGSHQSITQNNKEGRTEKKNIFEGAVSYSQVDITRGFGDNLRLGSEDWITTTPIYLTISKPESLGLPPRGADVDEIYRVASKLSTIRESIKIKSDGVYCPICHIANVDLRKLRTPCPKCGRELLKFGWD